MHTFVSETAMPYQQRPTNGNNLRPVSVPNDRDDASELFLVRFHQTDAF